jgi:hypothetical protein
VEPSWILGLIPDLREKLEMRDKEVEFRYFILASSSLRDDGVQRLCLARRGPSRPRRPSTPPVKVACRTPIFRASDGAGARPHPPPSPFFLLEIDAWVVDGHSSAERPGTIFGSIGQLYWPHFDFAQIRFMSHSTPARPPPPPLVLLHPHLAPPWVWARSALRFAPPPSTPDWPCPGWSTPGEPGWRWADRYRDQNKKKK